MKIKFLLLLNILGLIASSQPLAWAKGMGDTGDDQGQHIVTDAAGNVYAAGQFEGTVDFDPGVGTYNLVSAGNNDIFISKLDPSGNFQWAASFGGLPSEYCAMMCNDASGNLYVTGSFSGTVDFDPGVGTFNLVSAGANDIFILKLNSSGNLVWVKNVGGTDPELARSMALDASGNVYTTGMFQGTADFDPGPGVFTLTTSIADMFVLKLDPSGNFTWAKPAAVRTGTATWMDYIMPGSIVVDAAQNVYTTGWFWGTVDFDPGPASYTLSSGSFTFQTFISRLNASGNFVWARCILGQYDVWGTSLAIDAFANIYAGGFFSGTANFNPGGLPYNLVSAGNSDIFITKLDSAGSLTWAKKIGGTNYESLSSLRRDGGNIYATGQFYGTSDFDPGPAAYNLISAGNGDAFISNYDLSGNFIWAKGMGGTGEELGAAIVPDVLGNIFATGFFNANCDFDPGPAVSSLTSNGGRDIYIAKFGNCTFAITSQPVNQILPLGTSAQFVTASSNIASLFQWQQNTGNGFTNLTSTGQYSGVNSATLTISNLMLAQNNYSFRCIVTESTCVNISNAALLTVYDPTGIAENAAENLFEVYPNPTTNLVTIKTENSLAASYKIFDQTGREILNGKLNGSETVIDLTLLSAGLYFVQVGDLNQKPLKLLKE